MNKIKFKFTPVYFFLNQSMLFEIQTPSIVMLSLCSKSIIEFIHPWHVDWEVAGR